MGLVSVGALQLLPLGGGALLGLLLAALLLTVEVVRPGERLAVTRDGEVRRVLGPGPGVRRPVGVETQTVDVGPRRFDLALSAAGADGGVRLAVVHVEYAVSSVERALSAADDPGKLVRTLANEAVRDALRELDDDVYDERNFVTYRARDALAGTLAERGVDLRELSVEALHSHSGTDGEPVIDRAERSSGPE